MVLYHCHWPKRIIRYLGHNYVANLNVLKLDFNLLLRFNNAKDKAKTLCPCTKKFVL